MTIPQPPKSKRGPRKSLFGAKVHPSQKPKKPMIPSRKGPGGSKISSKPLAERLPVEGTEAWKACRTLGVEMERLRKSPDISQILARSVGPRQRVIDSLRFSEDPSAIAFLNIYDDLSMADRRSVPFEAVCINGDISPASVLGAALVSAKIVGAQESMLTTAIEHPELVRKTFEYAKSIPGAHADRRMLLEASGYLPNAKGGQVNVNLLNGSPQLAQPALEAEESEEESDERTFETAFPSINQSLELWGEKRRKLLEGGKG